MPYSILVGNDKISAGFAYYEDGFVPRNKNSELKRLDERF